MGPVLLALASAGAFAVLFGSTPSRGAQADGVVPSRSATRAQSIAALSGGGPFPIPCLTPVLFSLRQEPSAGSPATRRAFASLFDEISLPGERRRTEPDDSTIRYSDRASFDRVDVTDEDADGRPDLVAAVASGLAEARRLFVEHLGLASPGPVDVLLVRVGSAIDGYLLPAAGRSGRPLIVLEAAPRGGASTARRAAIHQYAHAVAAAAGPAIPMSFAEGLATWALLRLEGNPDARTAAVITHRLRRLSEGLLGDDMELAAGNAAWFAYLDEAYGPTAVGISVQELAAGASPIVALDRALRRTTGETLASGFRDFQLWALLVGDRSDGRHFSFADRIGSPSFASTAETLPALAVQSDPAVSPLGGAQILVRPHETRGGLTIRFEGEIGSRWEADLLLVGPRRMLHRVPIGLDAEGRGSITVPLDRMAEVVLLARNLDLEDRGARRYTWSAHREPGFPFELSSFEVGTAPAPGAGVAVSWETSSERSLAGFNVLRRREGADSEIRVNPIWVPAVGDSGTPASYRFLDDTAEPGIRYAYRIEGITPEGLSSISEPASIVPPPSGP